MVNRKNKRFNVIEEFLNTKRQGTKNDYRSHLTNYFKIINKNRFCPYAHDEDNKKLRLCDILKENKIFKNDKLEISSVKKKYIIKKIPYEKL